MGKRTKLLRVLILTLALVICLGMLFTSCGDDEEAAPTPPPTTPPTTAPTKPVTPPTSSTGTTDPSQGTTDPSEGTTDPSQGTTDPSEGTTDPSEGTTDPSQGTTDPSQGTTDPSEGTTDPSEGTTDPSEGTTDPSEGTTDSSNKEPSDEPCTEHKGGVATCKKPAICEVCGESYGELGDHDWVAATCKAPKTCNVCGETEGEKLDHVGGSATCESLAICDLCHEGYGVLADHTWTDATCDAPKTCSVCGETDGEKLGHKGGTATCQATAVCEVCGNSYGVFADCSYYTADDAQSGVHFEITKAPDCVNKGEMAYKCTVCGELAFEGEYIVEIDELGHDRKYNVVAPKCEVEGYTEVTCSRCDFNETIDVTPGLAHVFVEKVHAPECEVEGYTEVTCKNGCDYYVKKDIKEALKHTGGKATCSALAVCDLCGNGYGEYEDHVEKTAATCTAKAVCEVCGQGYGDTLPHTYNKEADSTDFEITLAPTCIKTGTKAYKCTVCSTVSDDPENIEVIPTIDHNIVNTDEAYFVREFKATCVADGYKVYKCCVDAECTEEKSFVTEKAHNNHVYDKKLEEIGATCSEEAYVLYGCSAGECGTTVKGDFSGTRLAHTFDSIANLEEFDAIYCTVCGQSYINVKTGIETKRQELCLGCNRCTCEALNNKECVCDLTPPVCTCEALNNVDCECPEDAEECTCAAKDNVDCTCDLTPPECTCEAKDNTDCICDLENAPCKCGVVVEWHGYTKPGNADAIEANVAFVKDSIEIGGGLIKLVSEAEANYTITIGEEEITVSGTEVVVDLYKFDSVTSVTIESDANATVVFYAVFDK